MSCVGDTQEQQQERERERERERLAALEPLREPLEPLDMPMEMIMGDDSAPLPASAF